MSARTPRLSHLEPRPGPRIGRRGLWALAGLVAMLSLAGVAFAAQPPVGLGTAGSFAVLAGTTVTNTGPSTVNGDLGVSPGTAVTGFPPGTVNGTIHASDAVAAQAQSDLTTAYNDAAGRTPATSVSGDIGGSTLTPGVYNTGSSLGLTGTLTLDAQGDPNAVFIFQVGSALTTASASRVDLINGAQSCNVFWKIGSSATLGTSSVFRGNLLALTSITVNNGATVDGRLLARNGAVTLDNDTITRCAAVTGGSTPSGGTTGTGTGTAPGTTGTPTGGGTTPAGGCPDGETTLGRKGTATITTMAVAGLARRIVVTGRRIRKVVFYRGGRVFATQKLAPFGVLVPTGRRRHTVTARVTFTDCTPPATRRVRFGPPRAPSQPPVGPPGFTG